MPIPLGARDLTQARVSQTRLLWMACGLSGLLRGRDLAGYAVELVGGATVLVAAFCYATGP